jgi:glucose 1-dehydrogenase/3-dehydrosphinganine reductase
VTALTLHNKRAVVTGGSRGIGTAVCRQLAAAGAKVAINYVRQGAAAHELADELNDAAGTKAAIALQADVSSEDQVGALFDQVIASFGGVDILVNNAGYESTYAALDLPMNEWDKVLNINLRGAFLCARAAARTMATQGSGGVIINNSSIHDSVPRLGLTHYCVAKAGLAMLTKALALEWAEHKIRVVAVAPGAIETDMNRDEITALGKRQFEDWIPMHRLGHVDDVAASIVFLASDAASYITGTSLLIDGGYALNLVRYDPRSAES